MAINRIEITDFLSFKGKTDLEFSSGINVFIGSNGTGKTTLLKVLYAPNTWKKEIQIANNSIVPNDAILIGKFFYNIRQNHTTDHDGLMTSEIKYFNSDVSEEVSFIGIKYNAGLSKAEINKSEINGMEQFLASIKSAVYIPVTEMLSHSKGLLELNSKYEMPFDKTQIDILVNAGLPVTREISPLCAALLEKTGQIIDGEVLYEDGKYFVVKKSGLKIEFSLEASGYQKFGLLWKLLRNGLLENGSVLFWDEPEASINPELMSVLVDILLELQRNNVQIFIATHSEVLASYFGANSKKDDKIMFYSFYKDSDSSIRVDKKARFDLLEPNTLTSESVKLYEKELERGLE